MCYVGIRADFCRFMIVNCGEFCVSEWQQCLLFFIIFNSFTSLSLTLQDFLGQAYCTLGEVVGSQGSRLEKALGWVGVHTAVRERETADILIIIWPKAVDAHFKLNQASLSCQSCFPWREYWTTEEYPEGVAASSFMKTLNEKQPLRKCPPWSFFLSFIWSLLSFSKKCGEWQTVSHHLWQCHCKSTSLTVN